MGTSPSRKEQIVDAALTALSDTPVDALSTRQIARRLGVSQPALFRHFLSREALILAVVAHARAEIGARLEPVIAASGDAVERLRALARALMLYVEARPGLSRLMFAETPGIEGPQRSALRGLVEMQRGLVAAIFREGQAEGSLRAGVAPEDAAVAFVGLLQGLVLQWQLDGRSGPLASALDPLLDLWLDGARGVTSPSPPPSSPPAARRAPSGLPTADLLDVRPVLAAGEDPFGLITARLDGLAPGSLLAIVAPFRPAPLIALLRRKGYGVIEAPVGRDVVVAVSVAAPPPLDLREGEPPGPMEAVLAALDALAPDGALAAWLPRHPYPLLPILEARGLRHRVLDLEDGTALLHALRSP